jgi:ribonuclease Z
VAGAPDYTTAVRLTLLGTGTPIPDIERRGPASLVQVGDERILIDTGAGVLHRLLEAGLPPGRMPDGTRHLDRILITHLHSDHITGLADLLWAGWIMDWWPEPPSIVGPPGTAQFVEGLEAAFGYDLQVRRALDRRNNPWRTPAITEVDDGSTVEGGAARIRAFRVDHHPVDQAFGFRIDGEGGSIGFSGDTRALESLAERCAGVDVLVHEVYSGGSAGETPGDGSSARRRRGVAAYHTSSYEVGRIAELAGTPHLVLNHMLLWGASPEEVATDAKLGYGGTVTAGRDLLQIDLERARGEGRR